MSDYQRLHDALEEKGFSPRPGDDGFFTTLYAAEIIRGLVKPDKSKAEKPEDKSKTKLKKEVLKLNQEIMGLKKQVALQENLEVNRYQHKTSDASKRPLSASTLIHIDNTDAEIVSDEGDSLLVKVCGKKIFRQIVLEENEVININPKQIISFFVVGQKNLESIISLMEKNSFVCIQSIKDPDDDQDFQLYFEAECSPREIIDKAEKLLEKETADGRVLTAMEGYSTETVSLGNKFLLEDLFNK